MPIYEKCTAFEQDLLSSLNLAIFEKLPVLSTHLLTVTANALLGLQVSNLAHAIGGTAHPGTPTPTPL